MSSKFSEVDNSVDLSGAIDEVEKTPKKAAPAEEKKNVGGVKKMQLCVNDHITIDFATRCVTWTAFGINEISEAESAEPSFVRVQHLFKEIK